MKTLIGIAVLMLTATLAKAQGTMASIPTPVMQTFTALYPTVKDVAWNYNEPNYEARFKVRNKGMMLMFDESGSVSEIKNEVPAVELPGTVRNYVETHYRGWQLAKSMHVIVNEEPYHEAYLRKGEEEITLVFDRNAQLMVTVIP
ncbi:MAG TPA: PepSY-like domain-containing protein [Chryseolinea sp.]|nr:PepSY-like domain-containing protein [Chryseolinea sp.]